MLFINLDIEKAKLEQLLEFYYYLENEINQAKEMFPITKKHILEKCAK